uniref:Uncharacterized protein n=1 Tax=Oryza punctata TaxID=4537 RepID=A0A0E0MD84_ORYPU
MWIRMGRRLLLITLLLGALLCNNGAYAKFNRYSFPKDFIFGTGSAAYQCSADNFDQEDVNLLKDMNMDAFRFSIAWTRILPNGSLSGGINREGIAFYNSLIDDVIAKGNQKDYVDFAEVCFREFGDCVKHWTTFNEPFTYSTYGYGKGVFAPGRCSHYVSKSCGGGDSSRETYLVTHHIHLSHAAAVHLYRTTYQPTQKGQIGMVVVTHWFVPYDDTAADRGAVQRSLDFMFGWFMDPLVHGDYPGTMKGWLRDRLPEFTPAQSAMVKGSCGYYGTYIPTSIEYPTSNWGYVI